MKLYYGDIPITSIKVANYELSTNDCTATASDLQAGITCVSKGKKITGTGKCFEFATYGRFTTNVSTYIPYDSINTIVVSSTDGAVKMIDEISNLRNLDYSTAQEIAKIILDGVEYSLTVQIVNNQIMFGCAQDVSIQAMIGKDNFI